MDFSDNKPEKVVLSGEPSGTFYPYHYKEQDPFMLMFSEDDTTSLVADTLIAFGKDSIETSC